MHKLGLGAVASSLGHCLGRGHRGPPFTNKKPARTNVSAGTRVPGLFSNLFYVVSKAAGSNHHGIKYVICGLCLSVKAVVG